MTMTSGQTYNSFVDTDTARGDLEHKIFQSFFNLYFAVLHDRNNPCCDHDMNSAIYAVCRMVFNEAGITDQALDIFEYLFPGLEADQ